MKLKRWMLSLPYALFLVLFVILPLLVVFYYAFTDGSGHFTMDNFLGFFTNTKTIGTLVYSLLISVCTTTCCLLIAYPTAYILAKGPMKRGAVYLVLLVMPMWINFTLRITALKEILSAIEGNIAYYTFFNTILCQTYDFLPFMIMPIYTCLEKIDNQYPEAALDLGAGKAQVFFEVILPLSMPGIISGITMVLLPAMTNYVVLDMIYNSTYIMGSLIGSYFSSYDWNNGSMISAVLLALIMLATICGSRIAGNGEEGRGVAI